MGNGVNQSPGVDIQDFIDQQPLSGAQLAVIGLCGSVLFMDGFDAQSMGFVAPALVQQLHIARGALGPVFSSGTLGIMIGALVFGPLADRFGRKPVIVLCTVLFGLFSLVTATAESLQALLVYRLLTGLGLGGAMPNAVALTSEFMPKRLRATAVTVTFVGFSIGAAVGGFVAAGLVRLHGWQSVFVVGGIVPCAIAVLLIGLLPESIRYLLMRGSEEERVARSLSQIAPGVSAEMARAFVVEEHRSGQFVVKQLFARGRTRMTLLIWVIFFMSLLDLYFLNAWLPTVIHDAGAGLEKAIVLTALFQVGGAFGSVLLGRLLDRRLSFRVLAGVYLAAAFFVFLIGTTGNSVVLLACTILAAGFAVIGGQSSANALAAEFYPTPIRSTGVGWALGIGRVGSILGPLLGGVLLSLQQDTRRVFWAAAVPALIASFAGLLAGRTPVDIMAAAHED
jgi:AAHS family 4-hydroxybenzoate transporter-like MFS transporter